MLFFACAPAPAPPSVMLPLLAETESATPTPTASMSAFDCAASDSVPPARTSESSIRARVLLPIWLSASETATPSARVPLVPPATVAETATTCAVMEELSVADSVIAPGTCAMLSPEITASVSVVVMLVTAMPAPPPVAERLPLLPDTVSTAATPMTSMSCEA